jgi:hypothetical protein
MDAILGTAFANEYRSVSILDLNFRPIRLPSTLGSLSKLATIQNADSIGNFRPDAALCGIIVLLTIDKLKLI